MNIRSYNYLIQWFNVVCFLKKKRDKTLRDGNAPKWMRIFVFITPKCHVCPGLALAAQVI